MIVDGWHWPDADRDARGVIMRDAAPDIAAFIAHVPGRKCIVQAGANVGVYPVALAGIFEHVYTVEPDVENYQCLNSNLLARDVPNITYQWAAFGEGPGSCKVKVVSPSNCGAHRVEPGGTIPVITIDDLNVNPDAIWLDVEGYELMALKGAVETIQRCSPVIGCEEKGLGQPYGVRPEDIGEFLARFGYERVARIGRDNIYRRAS